MASTVKDRHPYVKRVPEVCGGEPVIAGTRFPVRSIVVYIPIPVNETQIERVENLDPAPVMGL